MRFDSHSAQALLTALPPPDDVALSLVLSLYISLSLNPLFTVFGRDYVSLAKGFPALALMSEGDLARDFTPFAEALEGALDPIVTDFRLQMVMAHGS